MDKNDTSRTADPEDARQRDLLQFLARSEPLIRRQIRRIRGPRDALLSTSGLYATVVAEMTVGLGGSGADGGAGTPGSGGTRWARILTEVIRDSVTQASRTVHRWRRGDTAGSCPTDGPDRDHLSPLRLAEFRRKLATLIDGLDRKDREILYLRMKGNGWAAVAAASGISEVACRQRWVRMAAELRDRFRDD